MTAGIPGLGLAGLFLMLSALGGPVVELVHTARGRSSRARWLAVARQFLLGLAMILAIDATLGLVGLFVELPLLRTITFLSLAPIAVSTCALVLLLAAAKGLHLATDSPQTSDRPLSRRTRVSRRPPHRAHPRAR